MAAGAAAAVVIPMLLMAGKRRRRREAGADGGEVELEVEVEDQHFILNFIYGGTAATQLDTQHLH